MATASGDGCCVAGEDTCNCPDDCSTDCGDGICDSSIDEDAATCPADCP